MNSIHQFFNYSNPFSPEFHQSTKYFNHSLNRWQKAIVIIATVAAGILSFGISSCAAFRFTVEKLNHGDHPVADRTDAAFRRTITPGVDASPDTPLPASISRSADSTPPPPVVLTFRNTNKLIDNAKLFAFHSNRPLTLTVDDQEVTAFYDDGDHSVKINNGEMHISISSLPFQTESPIELTLIEAVSSHLDSMKENFNKGLSEFQPQTLKLIKSFFNSERGQEYDSDTPWESDGMQMWPETDLATGQFDLHIWIESTDQEIIISLDNEGIINAVFQDDQQVSPLFLFDSSDVWNNVLTMLLHDFLKAHALNVQMGPFMFLINMQPKQISSILHLHPAIISELPEFVLSKLTPMQMYKFFNDDLTDSPGIDAGGLKRQLFTDLALHLFDGSPNRGIKMEEGVPTLENNDSNKEKDLLKSAGRNLIRLALIDPSLTLGSILTPTVYQCVNLMIKFNNQINDDILMQSASLLCQTEELRFFFDLYNRPRELTPEEITTLTSVLMAVDEDEVPTNPAEVKELAKTIILDENRYRAQVMAIHSMVEGIMGETLQEQVIMRWVYESALDNLTHEQFCERIQGVPFDPQDISSRIFTNSDHPVVREKAAWLQEYILESDEEEIKRVLMAVTGSTTVTASTRIEIKGTQTHNCTAATCTPSLSVPTTHTSVGTDAGAMATRKEMFLNNFRLIYSEKGFDMG